MPGPNSIQSFTEKFVSLMARPNQDPQPQDDFPWYMKYGARVIGIIGAGCKFQPVATPHLIRGQFVGGLPAAFGVSGRGHIPIHSNLHVLIMEVNRLVECYMKPSKVAVVKQKLS